MITHQGFRLNYCPSCKAKLQLGPIRDSVECPIENKILFINPAPCINVYIMKNKHVLLGKRAIDPFKGSIDVIGGFVDRNESVEETVRREALEETGLSIEITKYLGSAYDTYGQADKPLVCMAFVARVLNASEEPKANDDVADLFWHPLKAEMPKFEFTSAKFFYKLLQAELAS